MSPRNRCGLTLVEVTIALVVVGILLSLLIPVLGSARATARQVTCGSRLRQHLLGLHQYQTLHQGYPPGLYGSWGYSWHAALLPFLEQEILSEQTPWGDEGWWQGKNQSSRQLRQLATIVLPVKQCPSQMIQVEVRSVNGIAGRAVSSFNGCVGSNITATDNLSNRHTDMRHGNGVFLFRSPTKSWVPTRNTGILDGLSHTVFLGEVKYQLESPCWVCDRFYHYHPSIDDRRGWDMSEALSSMAFPPNTADASPPIQHELAFGSFHPGGLNMSYGDGRTSFISESIDLSVWQSWGTMSMSD
jgi:prepilin-type N-terminal cleavage/methylation domain-containing protein/prepilin-type processing-associated H-X9-DG protein